MPKNPRLTKAVNHQYIQDPPLSRRGVLRGAGSILTLGAAIGFPSHLLAESASIKPQVPEFLFTDKKSDVGDSPLWGMAMSYGEKRLDLIDLDNSRILHSFQGFQASHAIISVEHLNRFVVHGYRPKSKT